MGWTKLVTESLGDISYNNEEYIFTFMELLDEFGNTDTLKHYLKYIGKSKTPSQPIGLKYYSYMFHNCNIDLDLSHWDMSEAEDLECMFNNCNGLDSNLSFLKDWNVSNVKNMQFLFTNCNSISNVDNLKSWNVSKCLNFDMMFYECNFISNFRPLNKWRVNRKATYKYIFDDCCSIKKYPRWYKPDHMKRLFKSIFNSISEFIMIKICGYKWVTGDEYLRGKNINK